MCTRALDYIPPVDGAFGDICVASAPPTPTWSPTIDTITALPA
jgi:hypothetical protein